MLHVGLDLSRRKVDVCLLSGRRRAAGPARRCRLTSTSLRALARRIDEVHGEPVCAVVESMTGARLRPRHARAGGLGRSRSPTPRRSRASPPWPARPTRSTRWCWRCSAQRDLVPAIWLPDPAGPRAARARALPVAPGQAQVGAQEPGPLDADQLRPAPARSPTSSEPRADSCSRDSTSRSPGAATSRRQR